MVDIDKELDIHLHAIHDSSIDQWIFVADSEDNACCITLACGDPVDAEDLSQYVSRLVGEWVKEIGVEQLNKRRTYLSAQLKKIDERISEVSE